MTIEGETFDDVLRRSIQAIRENGHRIKPTKGEATEIIGATLKLNNPLARFSRTEQRGVFYSALGETLWYLSGSDKFGVIEHYIPRYRSFCETPDSIEQSEAAYGPRLQDQMKFIVNAVKKEDTRKAVISIYRDADHYNSYDVPCTCTLQFFPRSGALHALAYMRSNDVYKGLPHDIFAFTMLQEILARSAGLEMGKYIHQVGSFHLYDEDLEKAQIYMDSGIADTVPMPPMPEGDPWKGLKWLLSAEYALRTESPYPESTGTPSYWQDLANVLRIRTLRNKEDWSALLAVRETMQSDVFITYLQDEIRRAPEL